jgi:L-ascorbate metabolism protein UlaG (beta-lactamase superfamily)
MGRYPMKIGIFTIAMILLTFSTVLSTGRMFESDTIATPEGDIVITFIGHGTIMLAMGGKVIHVDPWSRLADYSQLPDADLILITHEHRDHLDSKAIKEIRGGDTVVLANPAAASAVEGSEVMENGQKRTVSGFSIEAVPAYNIVHKRQDGNPFHPKGNGNGYVIGFGGKRIYIAGDTENIPEMKKLGQIDIAFIPVNLPYTMTLEMAADAARSIRPKILYPYHFGETRIEKLVGMLENESGIEVRIRPMK